MCVMFSFFAKNKFAGVVFCVTIKCLPINDKINCVSLRGRRFPKYFFFDLGAQNFLLRQKFYHCTVKNKKISNFLANWGCKA